MSDTFVMVKPDAQKRSLAKRIINMFKEEHLKVFDDRLNVTLTREQAQALYAEHSDKPFFNDIIDNAISGPVSLYWLKGDDAVVVARRLIGATDPSKRDHRSIRALFALSFRQNSVHGSDSDEAAKRELKLFFHAADREFDI